MLRLQTVRGLALQLISRLREGLHPDEGTETNAFVRQLQGAQRVFRQLGLRVELITSELSHEPAPAVTEAVVDAVRAALANTWQHARVTHAVICAADSAAGVEVVVRDHGQSFDVRRQPVGRGLSHPVYLRIAELGGSTEIYSLLDRRTRVRINFPAAAARA